MSTDDFKKVVDKIILFLMNQYTEHAAVFDFAKMWIFLALKTSFFGQLWRQISLYILWKIVKQYNKITIIITVLSKCTKTFTTIIELLCSHKILKQLNNKNTLTLKKHILSLTSQTDFIEF